MKHHKSPLISPVLGTSRHIDSFHFGKPNSGKKIYIQASLHADELPGMLVAWKLKQQLLLLEEQGFIKKEPYQLKPKRFQYTLLDKGRDLIPIMQSMSKWSIKYGDDVKSPPPAFFEIKV